MTTDLAQVRRELSGLLRDRRTEIEEAIFDRIEDGVPAAKPNRTSFLGDPRRAIEDGVGYGLLGIEQGAADPPAAPGALRARAGALGRRGLPIDFLFLDCVVGQTVFGDYAASAAVCLKGVDKTIQSRLVRDQAILMERLLAEIIREHRRATELYCATSRQRVVIRIERLMAGEPVDVSDLRYTFDAIHLGMAVAGTRALDATRALLESVDCQSLIVEPDEELVWAWLGGRQAPDPVAVARAAESSPQGASFAIGEPATGLSGWRLSHRQALSALAVGRRMSRRVVRYGDSMLIAAALRDQVLARSLRDRYLVPLERHRDGGDKARKTLRAYLVARQSTSSAAALLKVSPRSVSERLRSLEEEFQRPVKSAAAEIEAALDLWESDGTSGLGSSAG